jgi:hypothetical protein
VHDKCVLFEIEAPGKLQRTRWEERALAYRRQPITSAIVIHLQRLSDAFPLAAILQSIFTGAYERTIVQHSSPGTLPFYEELDTAKTERTKDLPFVTGAIAKFRTTESP